MNLRSMPGIAAKVPVELSLAATVEAAESEG